ncbi:uncharacterized protein B0H18DRAFT_976298 [Fomitopsis serialis]|uniref:uncharacterized protein n=1 Tax=Fomitopsis serialis TaxID=139415 RepID=UPI0020080A99|nr:uncharacterized protein B0H18DRAFT_976298 [Neoantrodia serialis]KAH9935569.1 hypothetical protein B0H18DRAFT_976298 [Neoantrodia serialis]
MDAPDNIPGFLDPLLDHLSSALPPSVYDAVVSFLSYSISFCTSLFRLLMALASSNPASWDAQTILPPHHRPRGNGVGGQFRGGIVPAIGGMILDMFNGLGVWDRHQEWQYNEDAQNGGGESGMQQAMGQIFGVVGRTIREGGWWEAAKSAVDNVLQEGETDAEDETNAGTARQRKQPPRKAKSKPSSAR